jgi:hypothetical protein
MSDPVPRSPPAVDPATLAAARETAIDILVALDELKLCQAAAYISMAVDALDLAPGDAIPVRVER